MLKKKTGLLINFLVVVLIVTGLYVYVRYKAGSFDKYIDVFKKPPETMQYQGTITDVDYGCAFDLSCGILTDNGCAVDMGGGNVGTIDESKIGQVSGVYFTDLTHQDQYIGKRVEVYGQKTGQSWLFDQKDRKQTPTCWISIYGSNNYYVRLLEN